MGIVVSCRLPLKIIAGRNCFLLVIAQAISLRVCGAENPSQGPWEPGALGAALILGGLETAGGALQLPFPSL